MKYRREWAVPDHCLPSEKYEVVPDVLCLAKALGGGMPLGAFISSKTIMDTLAHNPALGHLTTFGGNPVSAAAACASFDILKESRLWESVEEKAHLLTKGLEEYSAIRELRKSGLLIALDFLTPELASRALEFMWANRLISDRFYFALRLSGFRPLIIDAKEANSVNQTLHQILKQLGDGKTMD